MIAVIDYDAGNVASVTKAIEKVGYKACLTKDPKIIKASSGVVLPGVGAFGDCIDKLRKYDLIDTILESIESKKPFLGICVGFQLLFEEGFEFGIHKGFGIFKGSCVKFIPSKTYKVPHMGWNTVYYTRQCNLFDGIKNNSYFYFVHSYYTDSDDSCVAKTDYSCTFTSASQKDNVFGVQFHPEKSQTLGLRIYKNFCNMCEEKC
ncbi:MAG: imidazole glycerol phosphate synthase subunit HisH [Desulfurella sp.]|uniref:Imidazole glycerol phosphate synthase subunit HisH n=1 Tax=Desulfurella multipotens TaxID=79269 RepID=A0A1G6QPU2_9BACT|nr:MULTISPECIES: imidazole glycerol phosphate synthase subunit HisH [Desulfurella]AHF96847.1 imidazole glycerol phosphate synthase [Desulfurella acetivorans A63]HEX13445.1 imidazole glycerol phosphate synthase subunit HisH [Desulfurella acetivorans]PMP64105.1 MAG: imidazole glycerol phosphate synthase subunit HisH [Desulfurella multipotens]PMP90553.1 MAG: imidazole glycerol phosphate synthase subunit HisH [Desulfurella sp.]SDC93705.1 glutamine amidotransferase [Desulfurella multipotens]